MAKIVDPLAILQLSDSHLLATAEQKMLGIATEYYFLQVLQAAFANEQRYDLVLITGDLAQNPCPAAYQRLARHLEAYALPVVCLPGNHDDLGLMQQYLNGSYISCRRHVLFEHWQLICLNSQIVGSPYGCIDRKELVFLEDCLQRYPQHYALVATHHHCLPTLSTWMDTMLMQNAEAVLQILQAYPQVKALTCGHIHQEFQQQFGNLQVLGNPSTCFQFTPNSQEFSLDTTPPGYRQWTLHDDGRFNTLVKRLSAPLSGLVWDERGYAEDP